ncbi:MAG: SDR family oxidoreductase [Marinilabiliales bacterium]|nr:SDR family oxidoreductase [Marinilabiliales bacterium]
MKILLTGSTGYIGKRLLQTLAGEDHEITCFVRNMERFRAPREAKARVVGHEIDLLREIPPHLAGLEIDVAFYLVHSMSASIDHFMEQEAQSALHFASFIAGTSCKQVIYLSGISNSEKLSHHLQSRKNVEERLRTSGKPLTVLRAGIIVGSGSASFEIIRDLMELFPLLLAPSWIRTRCQPLGIADVVHYLKGCMLLEQAMDQVFDIGGPEILTYREMLLQYAEVRGLRRRIVVMPFFSPRMSSYWLYFITSTAYYLAANLVNSMKVEVICRDNRLQHLLQIQPITYREACRRALERINLDTVASSWTDAVSMREGNRLFAFLDVPTFGVMRDSRSRRISCDPEKVLTKIFSIGGEAGWYYADWIWEIRGFLDKMVGGVGLRRGRRNALELNPGDALDFWRVLIADRENKRLLLFAEMKVPGDAWLEFRIDLREEGFYLTQTATFMPKGLSGRLYWWGLLPIHLIMFRGMIRTIACC